MNDVAIVSLDDFEGLCDDYISYFLDFFEEFLFFGIACSCTIKKYSAIASILREKHIQLFVVYLDSETLLAIKKIGCIDKKHRVLAEVSVERTFFHNYDC